MNRFFDFKGLFDSHSHFNMIDAHKAAIVNEALSVGVEKILDVATDIESSKKTLQNASLFPNTILPTAGIHPEWLVPGSDMYSAKMEESDVKIESEKIRSLIEQNPNSYFMIGETGLDYYWLKRNPTISETAFEKSVFLQKQLFENQIKIAIDFDLPVTIHSRDSHRDCINIVSKYKGNLKAIFHSFTGNIEEAKEIMDLGFPIGINGIITYKSAQPLRDALKEIINNSKISSPNDLYELGIFLETDSPLLIPSNIQNRKTYNSPESIKFIWEYVYNLISHR